MKNIITFAIFAFLLTGCIFLGPADALILVKGVAPKNGGCFLALHDSDGPIRSNKREVKGEFKEDFVVSPYSDDYFIEVSCNNLVLSKHRVKFSEASVKNPYNIGVITP